jgi:K+-transporting ATPase ATPase A chain
LEGHIQEIPLGPVASQVAIKQLGSNGGGFFAANSSHPFENPTPLSNFFEMLALLLLPSSMPIAFGFMIKNQRHGMTIFSAMFALLVFVLSLALIDTLLASPLMEGKEVRIGIGNSVLWSIATTTSSNGSINAAVSSLSPLSGGIALLNIMLGEVIFGGVGSGLYGMVLFIIIAVFIAGLMVGRTPEYLGKKIEKKEIKLALIGVLAPSIIILIFSAIAAITSAGLSSLGHQGPHGLSEILYAFSSAAGNNGSAFGSLNANTDFYNILLSIAMLVGRFIVIIPVLAIAGSLACKKTVFASLGTFPTEGPLFAVLLAFIVMIIGALTFFPSLALGPIMEQGLILLGKNF